VNNIKKQFGILKIKDMYIYKVAKLMRKLETKSLPIPIIYHFESITLKLTSGQKEKVIRKFL